MILWIVEDERKHASTALKAVKAAFPDKFSIYLNRDISWPKDSPLPKLETTSGVPSRSVRQPGSFEHLPDIVVLDLLLEAEESKPARETSERPDFPGSLFYERLREEEDNAHRRRSEIIVYSQFRGMTFTEHFINERHETDNHFDEVWAKSPELLVEKLHESVLKIRTER